MRSKLLSLSLISGFIFFQACQPEDDQVPVPTDNRDSYTGSWTTDETSQVFNSTSYQVNISKGSEASALLISNFYNLGFQKTVSANLSGTKLTIPSQVIDGYSISGQGTIHSEKSISLNYTVNDGSGNDNATAELHR